MRYICTYFDINFLPRGMALLDSIKNNCKNFVFYILTLDNETKNYLMNLNNKNIVLINIDQYVNYFNIDKNKYQSEKEFYFSITPSICLYILENHEYIDLLLYLDADVYLFNDIELLYNEIDDSSIAICSQRLPWYNSKKYGLYNVGVNSFRNDKEGIKCLRQWYKDCSTWKPNQDGYKLDFFSDQIWLDKWLMLYQNIKIIEHIGIDTAPWNANQYTFSIKDNIYYINDKELIIYHFSSIKELDNNQWHVNTIFTLLNVKGVLYKIYQEYIKNIIKYKSINRVNKIIGLEVTGSISKVMLYKILKRFHNHIVKI